MSLQSKKKNDINKNLDPEYLMDLVGSWNRYQAYQCFIFVIICIFFTYSHYLPILFLYTPEHHCFIPGGEQWNLTQRDLKRLFIPRVKNGTDYEHCLQYNTNVQEALVNEDYLRQNNWTVTRCKHGWHYELEEYYESITTEFNLVCDDSWKAPITEVIYFMGSACGMLFYGWIGDHFGRYWTILISNWSVFIFGLALGFAPNFILFTIIRFIMGLSTVTCLTSSFVLAMEYVSKTKRTIIGNFSMGLGIAIAGIIMPTLLYRFKNWRIVNHMLFAQGIFTLILPFLLNESIRWLLEREEYSKVAKILKRVAKINKKTLPDDIVSNLKTLKVLKEQNDSEENEMGEKKKEVTSLLSLFRTRRLRRHIITMIILWAMVKLLFETHMRSIKNIDVHVFYSFAIANGLEFIANMLIIWTMEWFGRRWMTLFCLILSGFPILIAAYFQTIGGDAVLLLVLSMVGRFGVSMVINVVMQFQVEICPTDLRARGAGLILFVGEFVALLAPVIIYSANFYGILPQLFMGIGGVLVGFLGLFLPETAGIEIPANAEQGEVFGKNQNFFYVPILNNKTKQKKKEEQIIQLRL